MNAPLQPMQFYHGTNAVLSPGDVLTPGRPPASGIREPSPHVFVTRHKRAAGDWAVNAAVGNSGKYEDARVYRVEPQGEMSDDPLERGSGHRAAAARVVAEVPRRAWSRGRAAYLLDE